MLSSVCSRISATHGLRESSIEVRRRFRSEVTSVLTEYFPEREAAMDLGCTFKLPEDANQSVAHRTSQITISVDGQMRTGTWVLVDNSSDPRVAVKNNNGVWFLANGEDGGGDTSTLYIARPSDRLILFELYGVSRDALNAISCGSGYAGTGQHNGPPRNSVNFSIWFSCA